MDGGLLTEREAAALLTLAPHTLAKWRSEGKGPRYVRLSNKAIRYYRADVAAFLDERTVDPAKS